MAILVYAVAPLDSLVAQEEAEDAVTSSWSSAVSLRAQSRFTQYGLDAAPDRVTVVATAGVDHTSGFSFDLSAAVQPDPWGMQRVVASVAYELSIAEVWALGLSLDHAWHRSGTINPLAASPTSSTISFGYEGDVWSLGAGYDRYYGGQGASYVSVDASATIALNALTVVPLASATFGSQTVTTTLLKRSKSKVSALNSLTTTVSGLSSIDLLVVVVIPLGSGWSCSAIPGVSYTPTDLATSTIRATWSIGVRKSL